MNYTKLTAYICTSLILLLAIYDGIIVKTTGGITVSVSIWFAQFGLMFAPLFSIGFLLGHFYGDKPKEGSKPASMTSFRLACTVTMIVSGLYDIITVQFFNPNHTISHLIPTNLTNYPLFTIVGGMIVGKFLGKMDPTKPAGDK